MACKLMMSGFRIHKMDQKTCWLMIEQPQGGDIRLIIVDMEMTVLYREQVWGVDLGCVQPWQNGAKRLLNGNGGALNILFWWRRGLWLWQLRRPFFVLFLKNFQSLMKSV